MNYRRASRCLGGTLRLLCRLISCTFRLTNRKTLCVFACALLCYASIFIVRPLTQLPLKGNVEALEERNKRDSPTRHLNKEIGFIPLIEDLDTQNKIASNLFLSNNTHRKLSLFKSPNELIVKSNGMKKGEHKQNPSPARSNDKVNDVNHRSYDEDVSDDTANEDTDAFAPETVKRKTIFDSYIHYKSRKMCYWHFFVLRLSYL